MRGLVCPYCFERFPASELSFRCINPDPSRCPPEEDQALARYQRLATAFKLPRVFKPQRRWFGAPASADCQCGMKTSKLVCPRCHNELPSQFGQTESRTIALVGAKESGKSHYIAVLIHELANRIGQNFNASLTALDEQTIQRYKQDFRKFIYDDRVTIPPTFTARANINVRYPMAYRFSHARGRTLLGAPLGEGLRVISLVFFDTAGEDLGHIDLMATETRYLANSDGIIFLLDPLQIPAVRDALGNPARLRRENTDPQEIIGRVERLIRSSRELGPTARIKTPVALAFSKLDEIRNLIDPGSAVHRASNHAGYFDQIDAAMVSDNMRAYVEEWVGPGLDLFMSHNFETFRYFGLSALGSAPDAQGRLTRGVAPFRVEDPLLWIFHQLKVIPGGPGRPGRKG
jgi:GTPase SAR1 family protein